MPKSPPRALDGARNIPDSSKALVISEGEDGEDPNRIRRNLVTGKMKQGQVTSNPHWRTARLVFGSAIAIRKLVVRSDVGCYLLEFRGEPLIQYQPHIICKVWQADHLTGARSHL